MEKIIDDKYYVDGGVYENCPIDMFVKAGYKDIYVVRNWQSKLKYKNKKGVKVHIITPREDLGSIMRFTKISHEYKMNLGYYDTIKYLDHLDGNKYYFKYYSNKYYSKLFDSQVYKQMFKKYNKGLSNKTEKEFIINVLEEILEKQKIERFKIYNIPFLLTRLKYIMVGKRNNKYYDFIKNIKIDFE